MKQTIIYLNWHGDVFWEFGGSDSYRGIEVTQIHDIDEIKTQIQNHTQQSVRMPLNMGVERYDSDSAVNFGIKSQELRFWVQPKLLYQDDIYKFIHRFTLEPHLVRFEYKPKLTNMPVMFQFKDMNNRTIVDWRPLNENDLVLNAKLEQIWPERTGVLPPQLTKLFNIDLIDLYNRQTGQFSNGLGRTYTEIMHRNFFGKRWYERVYE